MKVGFKSIKEMEIQKIEFPLTKIVDLILKSLIIILKIKNLRKLKLKLIKIKVIID